jgi:hypothetical protein
MVGKSKVHRGGAKVGAKRVDGAGATEDARDEGGNAGAPGCASTDDVRRADARDGAARVDEGRLLVALQLGKGTSMNVINRVGIQGGGRSHSQNEAPRRGHEKKLQTERMLCQRE